MEDVGLVFSTPSAPGDAATIDLFNSETAFGLNALRLLNIGRIRLAFLQLSHASAAGGLTMLVKSKGSTTWRNVTDGGTFPATMAAGTSDPVTYDVMVAEYENVKFEYENGATLPTTWEVTITAYVGSVHTGA
jgi:hypothetical protein